MRMKRLAVALAIAGMVFTFPGCTMLSVGTKSSAPLATAMETPVTTAAPDETSPMPETASPDPSQTPEETEPEPSAALSPAPSPTPKPVKTASSNIYSNRSLGLSFTMPKSWAGKYRVVNGKGYLSVYFSPVDTADLNDPNDGELFSIVEEKVKKSGDMSGDWTFNLNGLTYIWGSFDMEYDDTEPEYDTYSAMLKDIPAVFASVKSSLSGQAPGNVEKLWIESIPKQTVYTTTMGLGIQFTLPKSWLGKCRIVERKDEVDAYFNPKKPLTEENGDGWLFVIAKKSPDTEEWELDYTAEITVNGVTFICGGPTDVAYEGEEDDLFGQMANAISKVFDTIRAAPVPSETQTPAATPSPVETITATP